MSFNHRSIVTAISAAALLTMSGCQDDAPRATADLEVAEVKGIRFDSPIPASDIATSPVTTEIASEPAPTDAPIKPATAADVPDNIAMIPSATPVPAPPETSSTPEPAPVIAAPPSEPGSFQEVSFKVLSGFKYVEPIPQEGEKPEDVEKRRNTDQIPAEVKALDGKNAIVQGWMVPMEISEDGAVKSFVLVKTQPECCFGDMQAMNEWIDVIMLPGKSAEFNVDQPVKVYGKLEVGEKMEDGFVLSVYRMQAERVEI